MKINAKQPNIILILADDMGYSDIGCFGSEISTPNIDSLSAGGVNFTQGYNCARCCPSRASLLTGLNPHQAGVGHMVGDLGSPPYQGYLNNSCITLAEGLKLAGYSTALSGKWHTGGHYDPRMSDSRQPAGDPAHPTPIQRGFDEFYGILLGAGSYYNPKILLHNESFVKPEGDSYHFTDAVAGHCLKTIEEFATKDAPFFIHLSYTAPHWPLHAFEEDIKKYEGKYLKGWDDTRTDRHERLKGLGILDSKWDISPRDKDSPPWEDMVHKRWQDRRMAVYAAQVEHMDRSIGKVIARLKELDAYDNTMIVFLSDNGGCAEFLAEDSSLPIYELFDFPTRDGRPLRLGNTPEVMPGPDDTFSSYDLSWANVSNTPFKLYKHWVHEGGISTPLIISWPDMIAKRSIIHSPVHIMDMMPTFLEAAGASYPGVYKGNDITPMEGESLIPAFANARWERQTPLCWEHEGNRAVRDGRWKLVNRYPGKWELYDMEEDRTELNDLSERYRSEAKRLSSYYKEWASRCGVITWPAGSGWYVDHVEMLEK